MKILKCLICIVLLPALLLGCAGMNQRSFSDVKKEFEDLKSNNKTMKEKELYLAFAKLFQDIANGSVDETNDFADLTREIINNDFEFKDEEVFELAEEFAKLYSQIGAGKAEFGIQGFEAKSTADSNVEIKIAYLGDVRYSVKMVKSGESWFDKGKQTPYGGELGKYLLQIKFYDATLSSKFQEKYPSSSIKSIGRLSSGDEHEISVKGEYTNDHGYVIYVGCDTPFYVEEQATTSANRPIGSISVTMIFQ